MSVTTLGEPIARGRTADVFSWEEGQVLKLFHSWCDRDHVEYEAAVARAVHAAGLRVPAVGDTIQVNGSFGLIYERVDGRPMIEAVQRRLWRLIRLARPLARLHAEVHAIAVEADLPPQRGRIERQIREAATLPEPLRERLLLALDDLPDGDRICHGDFHPGNVLLTANGEVIIDWVDATRGNPLADVARTSVLARGLGGSDGRNTLNRLAIGLFHALYVRQYFELRPGGESEFRRWLPVVAAARLAENIPELEAWLVSEARKITGRDGDEGPA